MNAQISSDALDELLALLWVGHGSAQQVGRDEMIWSICGSTLLRIGGMTLLCSHSWVPSSHPSQVDPPAPIKYLGFAS